MLPQDWVSMRRLYRKLAFNYSEGGLGRLFQKTISFALNALYSETVWDIYVYRDFGDLDSSAPLVHCRTLTYQNLLDAQYFKAAAFPEEIRLRFEKQNICYGFYANESLAVIGWSSDGYLELDHGVVFPCPSQVALFDFVTLPEFRGRGLYTNALRHLVRNMEKPGARFVYIAVDPNNVHSVKGIQRAGFKLCLCMSRRRILGFVLISRNPAQSDRLASEP
jgi:GNAT superfamily N-acetyltransferase